MSFGHISDQGFRRFRGVWRSGNRQLMCCRTFLSFTALYTDFHSGSKCLLVCTFVLMGNNYPFWDEKTENSGNKSLGPLAVDKERQTIVIGRRKVIKTEVEKECRVMIQTFEKSLKIVVVQLLKTMYILETVQGQRRQVFDLFYQNLRQSKIPLEAHGRFERDQTSDTRRLPSNTMLTQCKTKSKEFF